MKRFLFRLLLLAALIGIISISPGAMRIAYAASFVVTNLNDSGDGSLRQAVLDANAASTDDIITFAVNGTITLTSGQLVLANNGSLEIVGNGAANTIISGNNASRVFGLTNGAVVTLNRLTVTNGTADSGGGIFSNGALTIINSTLSANTSLFDGGGGGIFNNGGTLTVTNSIFSGNHASGSDAANGGGINNNNGGTLTVSNTTFSGNTAGSSGGGIWNNSTASITNSVFSGNSGNAIFNSGTMTVTNSTLTGNGGNGGISNIGLGSFGTLTLNNTIVANNTGGDCVRLNGTINASHSLIGDGLGCVNGTNTNNLTGNPQLNGDLTLGGTSIAIDAGNDALIPSGITTDRAGNPRIQGLRVDMGAYESGLIRLPAEVTLAPGSADVAEGNSIGITITRTEDTTHPLIVGLTVTPGTGATPSDYTLSGGSIIGQSGLSVVTIPAGAASVEITLSAVNNDSVDDDKPIVLTLRNGDGYVLGGTITSTITIRNEDVANIVVSPTSGLQTSESGGTAQFTLVLSSQPNADVTIGLSSSDTTEGTVSPESVTFRPLNWDQAQTVTMTGVDDAAADGDIAYSILTAPAVSTDPDYTALDAPDASVTNIDDDTAAIIVSPTSGLLTSESGGTAQFTLVLSSQ
ncbi:MAG: hypothetical protein IAE80_29135, partial [Anaerolinea sp.]|nr:hypothetical protein [Anaerolinea sp.]